MESISVIIINYNNEPYAGTCLEALFKNQGIREVIVVDDHSTDNSLDIIRKFSVKVIVNASNLGPVKSRNIGAATASKANKYFLFLDGDAKLDANYVETLVDFLEAEPKIGVVSGKVISEKGERMWYNFGYAPSLLRSPISNLLNAAYLSSGSPAIKNFIASIATPFNLNFVKDKKMEVDWVVEMAFMTRAELFGEAHGLDENFFMFFEGPDYCRRLRKLGYATYYLPEVSVHHLGGHAHSEQDRKRLFNESFWRYIKKHPKLI